MEAITTAITEITKKLSDEKFIQAIKDIVTEIAKAAPKLVDMLPYLADVIKKLGEEGLLDKIILIIGACILLMPLFATLQLLLLLIASPEIMGALLIGLGLLIYFLQVWKDAVDRVEQIIKSIQDPLNNLDTIFGLLYDTVSVAIGPLKTVKDIFTNIMDLVSGKQGIAETGTGLLGSALNNVPGVGTVYNIIFQKSVGNKSAEEVTGAIKSSTSRSY